jgi:hypothetical protein
MLLMLKANCLHDLLKERVKAIIQRDYWQKIKALVSLLRD